MTLFDTAVYSRRQHTPWARMSLVAFMKDMIMREGQSQSHPPVTLTCQYRPDVASRRWWTIEWYGEDKQRHTTSAQEFDLCLFRAAETDLEISRHEADHPPVKPTEEAQR